MTIYAIEEDSWLLSEQVKKYIIKNKPKKILDLGSGSGIQAETAMQLGINSKDITLTDIDLETLKYLRKKFTKSKVIKSNLFDSPKIKKQKFDLIIFNPPYLPEDKSEPKDSQKATTGGKNGDEIIIEFLKQLKQHLNSNGIALLLLSSHTPMKNINKLLKNYKSKKVSSKKIFFEKLYVWEIRNKS